MVLKNASKTNKAITVLADIFDAPKSKGGRPRKDKADVRHRNDGSTWTYRPPKYPRKTGIDSVASDNKPERQIKKLPLDFGEQNALGDELVEWSKSSIAESIEDFPLFKGYSPYKFYCMARDNEYFADCLDSALARLGSKMHLNARRKLEDGSVVMKTFALYNRMYRELTLENSKAMSSTNTVIKVVEDKIPSSDLVPLREVLMKGSEDAEII
jgi:hypothetical protein